MMTDDAKETDDLARVWLRGPAVIGEHFERIGERFEDSHTTLKNIKVVETPALAVVTCRVQYQMRWDQGLSVEAPTTIVFVREPESGDWPFFTRGKPVNRAVRLVGETYPVARRDHSPVDPVGPNRLAAGSGIASPRPEPRIPAS